MVHYIRFFLPTKTFFLLLILKKLTKVAMLEDPYGQKLRGASRTSEGPLVNKQQEVRTHLLYLQGDKFHQLSE